MSLNYQEIVDNLTPEVIEKLLYTLGAQEVIKKDSYLISNTICHNVSDGSMKLYYYYDSHTFVCYTECGAFSPFNFLKHYYEERGISYDWYKDVYCVLPMYLHYLPLRQMLINLREGSINARIKT